MTRRITRLAAAVAAAASLAALSAAPASAQEISITAPPCDDVPECVNRVYDTAHWAVQYAEDTYNYRVQPWIDWAACTAYRLATGEPCPE